MMFGATLIVAALLYASPVLTRMQDSPKTASAASVVTVPDTPAGRGLKEFIASFNAGGDTRKAWVEGRTTVDKETAAEILGQDAAFLEEHGAMTVVRLPQASPTTIVAIVRHEKTGAHGHLTIAADAAAPHKVTNMQLRGASPEEIKGQ